MHCQTDCWTKYLTNFCKIGKGMVNCVLVSCPDPTLSRGKRSGDQWATEEVEHCWTLLIKKAGLSLIDVEYFKVESFLWLDPAMNLDSKAGVCLGEKSWEQDTISDDPAFLISKVQLSLTSSDWVISWLCQVSSLYTEQPNEIAPCYATMCSIDQPTYS